MILCAVMLYACSFNATSCWSDCPKEWFKCASGQCIIPSMVCDGVINCSDKSDEDETTCGKS